MADDLEGLVSRNIRFFRTTAGLSQKNLADATQLHPRYVQKLETQPVNLTLESLTKIAKALHIEPYQLLLDPASAMPKPTRKTYTLKQAADVMIRLIETWKTTLD